jgi:predicted dehydrogenase
MSRPRIGFLGAGWIGRSRMEAILATGAVEALAICDPDPAAAAEARRVAPDAVLVPSLEAMLDLAPDGLVVATPSALHAGQAIAALERGAAVFCQKPLGRSAAEAGEVLDAAAAADRLLGVDLSYRFTEGMRAIRAAIRAGELGSVFAADLVFHNACGPDKTWYYDRALSGGGCVMDLGVHLVDLALWTLDFPAAAHVSSRLLANGRPAGPGEVEDYAVTSLDLESGAAVRIACSWRLAAGRDAIIAAEFYGTESGAALRNVDGSFHHFTAERFAGTTRRIVAEPPDAWGGRAAASWALALSEGARFAGSTGGLLETARILDRIYAGNRAIPLRHGGLHRISTGPVGVPLAGSQRIVMT